MDDYLIVRTRDVVPLHTQASERYRGPTDNAVIARALADVELQIEQSNLTADEAADARRDDRVLAVAPAMPTRLIRPFKSSKAEAGNSWGISSVRADLSSATGAGVTVAVLDTGIDAAHPAFSGVDLIQCDFSGDGDGDVEGHGTHCAGTIFGRDIDGVRIGVARGVDHALIGKVLGNDGAGDSVMLLKGMTWALERGAHVISMSLGFDFPGLVERLVQTSGWPIALATSHALESYRENLRAFDAVMQVVSAYQAFQASGLVVAASGNESRVDDDPRFRLSASLPSAAQGVLSIGAVARGDKVNTVAPFSNGAVKLVAPGVDIRSAQAGGGLVSLSGTSMACPHAAGVAALWWEHLGSLDKNAGEDVRLQLLSTARPSAVDPRAGAEDRGRGLVTAP
ncbi:S8 family peptidase [Brevundimonas vesicularis]|uniref:S8 family peptidase n=1 Tax=Brevundimonas vesicularis TaxID=41276 RepID=UPI0028AB274B|nr:S8 family serine peptidase [Brevundimonas vesicularis]